MTANVAHDRLLFQPAFKSDITINVPLIYFDAALLG